MAMMKTTGRAIMSPASSSSSPASDETKAKIDAAILAFSTVKKHQCFLPLLLVAMATAIIARGITPAAHSRCRERAQCYQGNDKRDKYFRLG
jgi:hypothetical protein